MPHIKAIETLLTTGQFQKVVKKHHKNLEKHLKEDFAFSVFHWNLINVFSFCRLASVKEIHNSKCLCIADPHSAISSHLSSTGLMADLTMKENCGDNPVCLKS